jgi:16S rRNA (cytidine1402-2'-O)-methyltransferase
MAGTLYIVATPLGNLADLTFRGAELLKTVPVVAAEDTRRTRQLLNHLEAHPRLLSFHAHSPDSRTSAIMAELERGHDVALVSDAGTPVISDPGAELVAEARRQGYRVVPVPGLTAAAAALSASGFPGDRYLFLGFIPRKGKDRTQLLERASREEWSVVFYEAPNRLLDLLADLEKVAGRHRTAVVARELTKLHEEIRSGTLGELARYYTDHEPRGEVTVVLSGSDTPYQPPVAVPDVESLAATLLGEGLSRKDAVQRLVEETGLPRNEVYRRVMDLPN